MGTGVRDSNRWGGGCARCVRAKQPCVALVGSDIMPHRRSVAETYTVENLCLILFAEGERAYFDRGELILGLDVPVFGVRS